MNRMRMSVVGVVAGLIMAGVMAMAAMYDKHVTPTLLSEWTDSTDGKLSICLTVNKTTFAPSENIVIRCAVRNNTDKPLLIIRPFGDEFYALSEAFKALIVLKEKEAILLGINRILPRVLFSVWAVISCPSSHTP